MHEKQLAQTVKYGRKVTFQLFDGDPVTGYLAGMDDRYFLMLVPGKDGFRKVCVAYSGSPSFELHADNSYADEPHYAAMEEIIGPFRGFVSNRMLGSARDDDRRVI